MNKERNQYDLKGRIAIVTGSAQGIGKAIAAALARNGAKVVVSDVLEAKGRETAAEIGGATFFPCDVSDVKQVRSLVADTVRRFGRLDIMVNNAGINTGLADERVTTDKYPDETWLRIINVDLNGAFYCCKAASSQMVKQKSGSIINIASVAGVVALRLQVGFVAAKAGVLKMTEAMACELGPLGIRVNAVSPGSTITESTQSAFVEKNGTDNERAKKIISFIPQGRLGVTEDMANAVAFLASDAASYINGHNLVVDGGWTCGFNRDF